MISLVAQASRASERRKIPLDFRTNTDIYPSSFSLPVAIGQITYQPATIRLNPTSPSHRQAESMTTIKIHDLPKAAPKICASLKQNIQKSQFSPKTYGRGLAYARSGNVRDLNILHADACHVFFTSEVTGSAFSKYKSSIDITYSNNRLIYIDTECTCPVRYECKHAAASLAHLVTLLKAPKSEEVQRDEEIAHWLQTLSTPPQQAQPNKPDPSPSRFLAYCLQVHGDLNGNSTMELHQGRLLKSGEHSINLNQFANPNLANPPKYVQEHDILPLFKFRQATENSYAYSFSEVSLIAKRGAEIILQALTTGHLYCIDDIATDYSRSERLVPVTEGAAIQPQLEWKTNDDGSIEPVLILPEDVIRLSVSPPLFINTNPQAPTLHALDASNSISGDHISSWEQGPVIPLEKIPSFTEKISTISSPIPIPKSILLETLKKTKPIPHLTMRRQNPFTHGGLHLSGQPEPIIAELSFIYHGKSYQPNLVTNPFAEKSFISRSSDTINSIPRSITAEKRSLAFITDSSNFVPAAQLDVQVKIDHRSAFLPSDHARYWELSAAKFITNFLPQWQEHGGTFSIDESAEQNLQEIDSESIFTGLNELPDHGIDWFTFDAGYLTPKGQKCSMLDLLGDLLASEQFQNVDPATIPADERIILRDPQTGELLSFPAQQIYNILKNIWSLFGTESPTRELHRIEAASIADIFDMDDTETIRSLAALGEKLNDFTTLPRPAVPKSLNAKLRDYQLDGFHWLQFLARFGLHGVLADDMGLGKTLQTLAHIQAEVSSRRTEKKPSLVIAPTSVVGNWLAEAEKFTPKLKVLLLNGSERHSNFKHIPKSHLVITSYSLVARDFEELSTHDFHLVILDEAQYIKNPGAQISKFVCQLSATHRLSLSGTPLENHLGELWSQMRFLMPGLLGSKDQFTKIFRTPIEKHHDPDTQKALNSRVAPLLLRRTKDQVATELPPKTTIVQTITLSPRQIDLYETVRAAMDKRVRDAIADKGLAKSQIIVLDALLKLRQICCHPQLLKLPAAQKVKESAKLTHLIHDLLPTLLEEGRKILLFSSFTSMLAIIEEHLTKSAIPFAKITGSTRDRQAQIEAFQNGGARLFLISLKAGGTGLNLTAADTVIHYDPWWNPAAENQATDRAHRIGQKNPVFVYKLITEGSIEQRIVELQEKKSALIESLLTDSTNKLKIDQATLQNLFAPIT